MGPKVRPRKDSSSSMESIADDSSASGKPPGCTSSSDESSLPSPARPTTPDYTRVPADNIDSGDETDKCTDDVNQVNPGAAGASRGPVARALTGAEKRKNESDAPPQGEKRARQEADENNQIEEMDVDDDDAPDRLTLESIGVRIREIGSISYVVDDELPRMLRAIAVLLGDTEIPVKDWKKLASTGDSKKPVSKKEELEKFGQIGKLMWPTYKNRGSRADQAYLDWLKNVKEIEVEKSKFEKKVPRTPSKLLNDLKEIISRFFRNRKFKGTGWAFLYKLWQARGEPAGFPKYTAFVNGAREVILGDLNFWGQSLVLPDEFGLRGMYIGASFDPNESITEKLSNLKFGCQKFWLKPVTEDDDEVGIEDETPVPSTSTVASQRQSTSSSARKSVRPNIDSFLGNEDWASIVEKYRKMKPDQANLNDAQRVLDTASKIWKKEDSEAQEFQKRVDAKWKLAREALDFENYMTDFLRTINSVQTARNKLLEIKGVKEDDVPYILEVAILGLAEAMKDDENSFEKNRQEWEKKVVEYFTRAKTQIQQQAIGAARQQVKPVADSSIVPEGQENSEDSQHQQATGVAESANDIVAQDNSVHANISTSRGKVFTPRAAAAANLTFESAASSAVVSVSNGQQRERVADVSAVPVSTEPSTNRETHLHQDEKTKKPEGKEKRHGEKKKKHDDVSREIEKQKHEEKKRVTDQAKKVEEKNRKVEQKKKKEDRNREESKKEEKTRKEEKKGGQESQGEQQALGVPETGRKTDKRNNEQLPTEMDARGVDSTSKSKSRRSSSRAGSHVSGASSSHRSHRRTAEDNNTVMNNGQDIVGRPGGGSGSQAGSNAQVRPISDVSQPRSTRDGLTWATNPALGRQIAIDIEAAQQSSQASVVANGSQPNLQNSPAEIEQGELME